MLIEGVYSCFKSIFRCLLFFENLLTQAQKAENFSTFHDSSFYAYRNALNDAINNKNKAEILKKYVQLRVFFSAPSSKPKQWFFKKSTAKTNSIHATISPMFTEKRVIITSFDNN